jgi:hypothetical protein
MFDVAAPLVGAFYGLARDLVDYQPPTHRLDPLEKTIKAKDRY